MDPPPPLPPVVVSDDDDLVVVPPLPANEVDDRDDGFILFGLSPLSISYFIESNDTIC